MALDLELLSALPDIIPQRPDLDGHVFVYSSNREFLGSVYAGEHQRSLVYLLDNAAELLADLERQRAEVARLTSELATAQAELTAAMPGPVVKWEEGTDYRGEAFWTCIRRPLMLRVQRSGWDLVAIYEEGYHELDSGPETGPAGQRAAEEAYFRAVGQVQP